ncbi:hypothetical protein K438DRAFT_1952461 [Mycena galopus ATCC 62051]|nr:hypothetical protein K438DRAFT_1952461 [Mycena galopus ATCC 62051]
MLVLLTLLCCGVQRRRQRQAALQRPYVPPMLPLTSSSRFPHGMQYGTPPTSYGPPPGPAPPGTEYPSANAAEFAPPPYVKEDSSASKAYAPPPGPPPHGIDSAYTPYSPPPGPPPRAHISFNSTDFNGGFRPPP